MKFKVITSTVCLILGFNTLSQNLTIKDYPFLSEKEIQIANKKNDYKIEDSNFKWKEWEGNQESDTKVDIVYKEANEPNKIDGKLVLGKDTFQIYGTINSASIWSKKLKGMIYIESKTGNDEFDYYFDTHIANINLEGKKYKIEVVPTSSSFYDEQEIELISNINDYKIDKKVGSIYEYKKDSISLKYYTKQKIDKETGFAFNIVNGQLNIGENNYQLFGTISEGEGIWGFASIWNENMNNGVITWDPYEESDSTFLVFKYCKEQGINECLFIRTELIKVLKDNTNTFGNGVNSSNGGFRSSNDNGTGIEVNSDFDDPIQKRYAISEPQFKNINVGNSKNFIVHLKILVYPDGTIKSIEHMPRYEVNSHDKQIIDDVIKETKVKLKYNKSNLDEEMTIFVSLRFKN